MNRITVFAAVAALALAAVGGALLLSAGHGPTAVPTTAPTGLTAPPTGGESVTGGADLPEALIGGWYGSERALPGIAPKAGTVLFLESNAMRFTQSNQQDAPLLRSSASVVDGRVQIVSQSAETYAGGVTCPKGTTGIYNVGTSASGRVLTIQRFSDPCNARALVLAGTWWKKACWNDGGCYGNLDPGTYGTQYFDPRVKPAGAWQVNYGALTFTVDAGWAIANDSPDEVRLMLASDYAREGSGIDPSQLPILTVARQPFPKVGGRDCAVDPTGRPNGPSLGDPRTPADIVTFLQGESWLQAGALQSLTVDGHQATSIDLAVNPAAPPGCSGEAGPSGEYLTGYGVESWGFGLDGTRRARVVLVDLSRGDVVAIVVEAQDKAALDAFLPAAMQVIGTFRFE